MSRDKSKDRRSRQWSGGMVNKRFAVDNLIPLCSLRKRRQGIREKQAGKPQSGFPSLSILGERMLQKEKGLLSALWDWQPYLSIQRPAVNAGRKLVHSRLDDCPLSCCFFGSVAVTSEYFIHKSEYRTGVFIYALSAAETSSVLAGFIRCNHPTVFQLLKLWFWRRRIFTAMQTWYHTLCFSSQSRVLGDRTRLFEIQPTKQTVRRPAWKHMAPFVVSRPFYGLRVVACKTELKQSTNKKTRIIGKRSINRRGLGSLLPV